MSKSCVKFSEVRPNKETVPQSSIEKTVSRRKESPVIYYREVTVVWELAM